MSETPRTDAARTLGCVIVNDSWALLGEPKDSESMNVVPADFARKLERELNELWSRFDKQMEAEAEVERLKAELAAETANREKCCRDGNAYSDELWRKLKMTEDENEKLKAGKVFVDPKWIYDLETQLAKAHEELCQAGLREYGN